MARNSVQASSCFARQPSVAGPTPKSQADHRSMVAVQSRAGARGFRGKGEPLGPSPEEPDEGYLRMVGDHNTPAASPSAYFNPAMSPQPTQFDEFNGADEFGATVPTLERW